MDKPIKNTHTSPSAHAEIPAKANENTHEYDWDFHVKSYDTDAKRDIRLSSLLAYNQEAGGRALDRIGATYEAMYDKDLILVFTKISVDIIKTPVLHDSLHLNTWHRGGKGVQFYRDTEITDENGELMVGMTLSCCCLSPATRKILRPQALLQFGVTSDETRRPTHRQPLKGRLPKDLEFITEYKVLYSDLDYNGHMNNTFYPRVCMDFMPGEMNDKRIKFMSISYIGETYQGDILRISAKDNGDGSIFFMGENPRGVSFEAYFEYEEYHSSYAPSLN